MARTDVVEPILEMVRAGRRLREVGGAEGSAGNLSSLVREEDIEGMGWPSVSVVPTEEEDAGGRENVGGAGAAFSLADLEGEGFLFTNSGSRLGELDEQRDFCLGRVEDGGRSLRIHAPAGTSPARPTLEYRGHLAAFAARRDPGRRARCVLHAQPLHLTALSHLDGMEHPDVLNWALFRWQMETLAALPEGVGVVPWTLPGSLELAARTARLAREHAVIVWCKHGLLALGESWGEVLDRVEYLETAARYYFLLEGRAEGFDEEELRELTKRFGIRSTFLDSGN
jgi:rhamnulose-1-phosphate aldolase